MEEGVGELQRKEEKWGGKRREWKRGRKPRWERRCGKNKRGKFECLKTKENRNLKREKRNEILETQKTLIGQNF